MAFAKIILSFLITVLITTTVSAESSLRKIDKMLDAIQVFEVPTTDKGFIEANKAADIRWKYFNKHKPDALLTIRKFVAEHVTKKNISNFAIIDMGLYLSLNGDESDKELAVNALMLLDVSSREAAINKQQLFQHVISLAQTGDERLLPFMVKQYLEKEDSYWGGNAMHPLYNIRGAMLTAYMFGGMGELGEAYLVKLLSSDHAKSNRIIGALNWMGTPFSVKPVLDYIKKNQSFDIIAPALGFMIRIGGVEGKNAIKTFPDFVKDEKALEYVTKVMPSINKVNSGLLSMQLENITDFPATLSDKKLENHIQIMLSNMGNDNEINPQALLNSNLSDDYILKQLLEIRKRMFWRLTKEGWDDIQITNVIINALQYRIAGQ